MAIQDSDAFLVARSGTNYQTPAFNLMAIEDTDLLVVNRGGTNYKVTGLEVKEELSGITLDAFKSVPLTFTPQVNNYTGAAVAWGENEVIAWGDTGPSQYFFRSTDGVTWNQGLEVPVSTYGSNSVLAYGGNNTYMFWPSNLGLTGFVSRNGGLTWQSITFPEATAGNPQLGTFLGCPGAPGDPAARFLITPITPNDTIGAPAPGYYTFDGATTAWQTTNVPLDSSSLGLYQTVEGLNSFTMEGYGGVPRWVINVVDQSSGASVINQFNTSTLAWTQIGAPFGGSTVSTAPVGTSWPLWIFYIGSPPSRQTFYWQGTGSWATFTAPNSIIQAYGNGWTGPDGKAIFCPSSQATGVFQMDGLNQLSGGAYVQTNMPTAPNASNYFKGKYIWIRNQELWYAYVSP